MGLARNLPGMRRKAEELKAGSISRAEYDRIDSMSRSKMYNIPNYIVSPFQVLILAICVIILYRLDANESDAKSDWGVSVVIGFVSALGLIFALPWFVLEKRRPGQTPPANMNIIRAGLWQWGQTATHIWRLKQTLLYLIGELLGMWRLEVSDCRLLTPSPLRRVFSDERFVEYDHYGSRNASERSPGIRLHQIKLPEHGRMGGPIFRYLCFLAPTTQVQYQLQDHVGCRLFRYRCP